MIISLIAEWEASGTGHMLGACASSDGIELTASDFGVFEEMQDLEGYMIKIQMKKDATLKGCYNVFRASSGHLIYNSDGVPSVGIDDYLNPPGPPRGFYRADNDRFSDLLNFKDL